MPNDTVHLRDEPALLIFGMRVGQGDCTIVKCPDGHVAIIDLGTTKPEPVSDDMEIDSDDGDGDQNPEQIHVPTPLFEELFEHNNRLNTLILTHSDRDHYNWVGILWDVGVQIDRVYHSGNFLAYKCNSRFGGSGTAASLIANMCLDDDGELDFDKIRGVTFNRDAKEFYTSTDGHFKDDVRIPIEEGAGIHEYSEERGIKIYEGGGCTIHILCGNVYVPPRHDTKRRKLMGDSDFISRIGAREINMASIVTLIEYQGKQIVICGDAVDATEKFILDTYPDLKDVEMLRVPHHGSLTEGSSHLKFVKRMNPRTIFVSAPFYSTAHKHPRAEVIDRWVGYAKRLRRRTSRTYGCWYYEERSQLVSGTKKRKRRKTTVPKFLKAASAEADVRITGSHDDLVIEIPEPDWADE